jgi:hypothetical protein
VPSLLMIVMGSEKGTIVDPVGVPGTASKKRRFAGIGSDFASVVAASKLYMGWSGVVRQYMCETLKEVRSNSRAPSLRSVPNRRDQSECLMRSPPVAAPTACRQARFIAKVMCLNGIR